MDDGDALGLARACADIRALVESGAVQLSLFDERDLVEVTSDAYPGERLVVCRNPLLAEERARKRAALLDATEAVLAPIAAATRREKRRLRGESKIGARVGRVITRYKMAKHFEWSIDEKGGFTYRRNASSIAAEAALDGLYVVPACLRPNSMPTVACAPTNASVRWSGPSAASRP